MSVQNLYEITQASYSSSRRRPLTAAGVGTRRGSTTSQQGALGGNMSRSSSTASLLGKSAWDVYPYRVCVSFQMTWPFSCVTMNCDLAEAQNVWLKQCNTELMMIWMRRLLIYSVLLLWTFKLKQNFINIVLITELFVVVVFVGRGVLSTCAA